MRIIPFSIFLFIPLTLLAYVHSFQVAFQLDDIAVFVKNAALRNYQNLPSIFSYDPSRFLTHLSFAINSTFHKDSVFYFHCVNFTLHVLNGFLVFLLVKKTLALLAPKDADNKRASYVSFFTSLIFLLHPVQTESVTYIVQRSTLLAACFYLLSLLLYLRLKRRWNGCLYILNCLTVMAGTMTKPIFVTLPIAILLYEFMFFDLGQKRIILKQSRQNLLLIAPYIFVLLAVPFFVMLYSLNYFSESFSFEKLSYATRVTSSISRWDYLLTQFKVLILYLGLLFWPARQNLDYDIALSKSLFEADTFVAFFALTVIAGGSFYFLKRRPILFFSLWWFFIVLIPESSIFPLPDVVFEHRLYLAAIGFALFVCEGLLIFIPSLKKAGFLLALFVLGLGLLTYARNELWRNPVLMWQNVVEQSPRKARAHHLLGEAYEKAGFDDLAERENQKAVSLDKVSTVSLNSLGRLFAKKGDYDKAVLKFKEALNLSPYDYDANFNLGNVYITVGQWKLAVAQLKKAAEIRQYEETPYCKLGEIFLKFKEFTQAETYYRKATELNPSSSAAYYGLGNVYLEKRLFDKAVFFYQKATFYNPSYADAYNTLGIAYISLGSSREAEESFQKAVRIKRDFILAYFNLAKFYTREKRLREAKFSRSLAEELLSRQGKSRGDFNSFLLPE